MLKVLSSLSRVLFGMALAVTVLIAAGCRSMISDPKFKEGDLVFDPRLIGVWSSTPDEDRVEITETYHPVADGRLKARSSARPSSSPALPDIDADSEQKEPREVRVYEIRIGARKHVLRGYPIRTSSGVVVCLQAENREHSNPSGDVRFEDFIAVHLFVKVGVRGDELWIWRPRHMVGLIAAVRPIDARNVDADASCVEVENLISGVDKDGRMLVTSEPDRAAGLYRRYAELTTFWEEKPTVLKRVGGPQSK